MLLVSSCSCLCPIHWSQVLSWEWECSWSSADRHCSNYIWVINNFIAYIGAAYIWDLTVYHTLVCYKVCLCLGNLLRQIMWTTNNILTWMIIQMTICNISNLNDIEVCVIDLIGFIKWHLSYNSHLILYTPNEVTIWIIPDHYSDVTWVLWHLKWPANLSVGTWACSGK